MDTATLGVLSDAGVFGSIAGAPSSNMSAGPAAGNAATAQVFGNLGLSGGGGSTGVAIVSLLALALLVTVYIKTRGVQH